MQAEVFKRGGMAAIEYEGTTLTLQAKSRAHGGQWLIMRGCEFRPEAVGRQVPQDSESEGMTKARVLLDSIWDNRPDSDLAKSLYMHTKTTLGTIDITKLKIGASLSAGLLKVDLKYLGKICSSFCHFSDDLTNLKCICHSTYSPLTVHCKGVGNPIVWVESQRTPI